MKKLVSIIIVMCLILIGVAAALKAARAEPTVERLSKESLEQLVTQRDRGHASRFCGRARNGNTALALVFAWQDPFTGQVVCTAVCEVERNQVQPRRDEWSCAKPPVI